MNYIKYTRTFVMMEEQTADFSAREAPVKGYLKVETGNNKGALRCVVQNLKYYSRGDYIYKLILFGKHSGRTVHTVLGSLTINRYGNGETYFRFDPLDMDGKGSGYADYTIAIVAAVSGSNDKEPLHPVLKGVMRKSDPAFDKPESEEEMQGVQLVMKPEEGLMEAAQEQHPEEPVSALQPEQLERTVSQQEQIHEKPVNYNSFYNEYLLQFCGYTCKAANYYEDVFPFENDRTGARWKKIQNVASLPLVSPGAHFFATQYRHFLFGARPDTDGVACRYFFAVPGRFVQEEQPDGGRSGFVYWQPVVGAALSGTQTRDRPQSGYGYWIVAVDATTGDIIEAG